jgi:hypothetical protein
MLGLGAIGGSGYWRSASRGIEFSVCNSECTFFVFILPFY